jgi:magnesium-transporting ATPase (P-type)
MDQNDTYNQFRGQVEHENELFNHRLNWLILMQTILVASLAVLFEAAFSQDFGYRSGAIGLLFVVCLLGMLISIVCYVALQRANAALDHLREEWREIGENIKVPHPSGAKGGASKTRVFKSTYLPLYFFTAWISAIVIVSIGAFGC